MTPKLRFLLFVTVVPVLLAGASQPAQHSLAAPLAQAPVPGEPDGQEGLAAAPSPAVAVPGGPRFQMVSAHQFKPWHPGTAWEYYYLELYNPGASAGSYAAALTLPDDPLLARRRSRWLGLDGRELADGRGRLLS
jgi:hypothetical protein